MNLESQLAQLEHAQLVGPAAEEDGAMVFCHALTQDAAYQMLLLRQRREIHRSIAKVYEFLEADLLDEYASLLAYHYSQAKDDEKTYEYAVRAGDSAASLSAYLEARSHYDLALIALARLPDSEENRRARVDTILRGTEVAWAFEKTQQNLIRLFQAEALAQNLSDENRLRLARVRCWIGRVYSYGNRNREALRYYELVLDTANEANDQELLGLALALGARTLHLQGYFGKAVPLFERALPLLEMMGEWQEWILAKVSLAISLAAQGRYRQARTHSGDAIQRAQILNERGPLAIAHLMAARVEFMMGREQQMLDEVLIWRKEAKETYPLVYYMALGFQAWAEGRLGMYESARATIAASSAIANQFGSGLIFSDWFDAARAETELRAGDIAQAIQLANAAILAAREAGGIFSEGIAQRVWGQALAASNGLNDLEADEHLQISLRLFEGGEAMIEAARTRLAWGNILCERGDADSARAHLDEAAAQFEASGMQREFAEARRSK